MGDDDATIEEQIEFEQGDTESGQQQTITLPHFTHGDDETLEEHTESEHKDIETDQQQSAVLQTLEGHTKYKHDDIEPDQQQAAVLQSAVAGDKTVGKMAGTTVHRTSAL